MKTLTGNYWGGLGIVISLVSVSLALSGSAVAQSKQGDAEEHVKVLAHLDLPQLHVNEMFVQRRGSKHYLYLHRPAKQAFAVVDVTKPEKPELVERAALTEPAHSHVAVNSTEPLLVIAVAPEESQALKPAKADAGGDGSAVVLPTQTLKLLNLSDPKHPKVLKTFTGVTSFLTDDSRKLIYIVNHEGLWIVSHRQSRPMPFCTSTDALMQDPNCQ